MQEYLQYRGFTNTLDCFQAEYLSRQYAVTSSQAAHTSLTFTSKTEEKNDAGEKQQQQQQQQQPESRESVVIRSRKEKLDAMLTCFDTGDSEGFAQLWYTHIPLYVRQEDQRIQKAFFMARVHFLARCWCVESKHSNQSSSSAAAALPATPASPSLVSPGARQHSALLSREMVRFRTYLEGEGGDIAGTDQTLEKYPALLFVRNPTQHSSFTECFSGVGPVVRDARSGVGQGGNRWTKDIRQEILSVVDDTLQHVPAPRLLQMYDAFMTNYASFDVQLRQRRQQNEVSRLLSKKLYKLSIKMARDITEESIPKDEGEDSTSGSSKSKYVSNIRRELKMCREQMSSVTLSGGGGGGGVLDENLNSPIHTDSGFLLGQPPSLDYTKVHRVLDLNDEQDTSRVLDSLWWRMAKTQPPSMNTPGLVSDAKMIALRKNVRKSIAIELTGGDLLCLRSSSSSGGGGGGGGGGQVVPLILKSSTEAGVVSHRQTSLLRVLDSLAGWSFGREYLTMYPGGWLGLTSTIWQVLVEQVQLGSGEGGGSDSVRSIARRHGLSCLQRLSIENDVADALATTTGVVEVLGNALTALLGSGGSGGDTGTVRFTTALLLNVLGGVQRTGDSGGALDHPDKISTIAECLCTVMEKEATTEGGEDKWGRRYAASALYSLVSTIANRAALNAQSGGRVAARIKTLLAKRNLTRGNKMFCHELKHILLRLENETNDIPLPSSASAAASNAANDVDEDWYR